MFKQILTNIEEGVSEDAMLLTITKYDYFMLPYMSHLNNLRVIDCSYNKLLLVNDLPPNLEILDCRGNDIIDLELPKSLVKLNCEGNDISHLVIPEKLEELYANNGKITCITNNSTMLRTMLVKGNLLSFLEVPESVRVLDCSNNFLSNIELSDGIEDVNISGNNIPYLVIPESVKRLNTEGTGIKKYYRNLRNLDNLVVSNETKFVSPLIKCEVMYNGDKGLLYYESCMRVLSDFCKKYCVRRMRTRREICKSVREFGRISGDPRCILDIYKRGGYLQVDRIKRIMDGV